MVLNCTVALAVKVEIRVVREIYHGILVRLGGESEFEGVVVRPLVMGHCLESSGISFLSVFGNIHEFYGVVNNAALPNLVGETPGTAVQMVGTVVYCKVVLFSVQLEMALGNSVGKPSGNPSQICAVVKIRVSVVKAQRYVSKRSILVRNKD